jgi:hypothetical protein
MINGTPATAPAPAGDAGISAMAAPDDVASLLAQLKQTMCSLDALLATLDDVPDAVVAE